MCVYECILVLVPLKVEHEKNPGNSTLFYFFILDIRDQHTTRTRTVLRVHVVCSSKVAI